MASNNFEPSMALVFKSEGGLSLDPKDPGNYVNGQLRGTKYGIAARSHPTVDIRNLTRDEASAIYRREYWGPAGCEPRTIGLDYATFDCSVNAGVGSVNPMMHHVDPSAAIEDQIRQFCAARLAHYRTLSNWNTYRGPWTRRMAQVQHDALYMVGAKNTPAPAPPVQAERPLRPASNAHMLFPKPGEPDQVRELQTDLVTLGLLAPSLVTGNYGPRTREAVLHFQQQAGLVADGMAGPATWAKIVGLVELQKREGQAAQNQPGIIDRLASLFRGG